MDREPHTRFRCTIHEVVARRNRPTILITDTAVKDLPLHIRVGDVIELRSPDGHSQRTYIAGVEHSMPYDSQDPFAFMLPRNVEAHTVESGYIVDVLEPAARGQA